MKRRTCFGFLLPLLLSACRLPCSEETPGVIFDVVVPSNRVVQDWSVLDGTGLSSTFPNYAAGNGRQFVQLPLNLGATQTRYTVRIDGKVDTLTVRYAVRLGAPSAKCGYSVQIVRPAQGPAVERVLGPVEAVYYSTEVRPPNLPAAGVDRGFVRVQLSL